MNAFGEEVENKVLRNGIVFANSQISRDSLGRISTISKTIAGQSKSSTYAYDPIGQIMSETNNGVTTNYTYSNNGNRFTNLGAEVYDSQDRLISNSTWKYIYNKSGYLSQKNHVSNGTSVVYLYDSLGNLLSVQYSSGTRVDYLVDGQNRRVRKNINGVFNSAYIFQDDLKPVAQLNSNGSVKSTFVYGSKENVPDLILQGTTTYRIISDVVGSPQFVINTSNGQITQQITYDTWGNVLTDSNPGFQPFGFAGGLYDPSTKLVRFGARDYDPAIGRWLNKDPIRFDGGINLYRYTENDPVNKIDPSGEKPGDLYRTKNLAAIAALDDIYELSKSQNTEYAGMIYLKNGSYSYTSPNKGGEYWSYPGSQRNCPSGTTAVGTYHTHGAYSKKYKNEIFSKDDIKNANFRMMDSYLKTPKKKFLKYQPNLQK